MNRHVSVNLLPRGVHLRTFSPSYRVARSPPARSLHSSPFPRPRKEDGKRGGESTRTVVSSISRFPLLLIRISTRALRGELAPMGTPEFPDLGKHCSVDDCKQIDFLPFTCDRCSQVFCLQHRGYTKHLCPNANQKDVTVLICPLCAKSVRLVPNEDPNITWESHVNSDCDPSNYQKATKKKRCPVPGCKETLTFSNTIRCRDCTKEHCLKHRFGPDHKCTGPKKPDPSFPFISLLRRSQKGESISNSAPNGSSWWRSSFLNAASNAKASAEAGVLRLSNATTQAFQKARDGIAQSSSSGALVEQCVQCQARFSTLSDLIDHAERCHQSTVQLNRNGVTIDICPKCSKGFQDPVLLVEHVERDHGGTSKVVPST